MRIWMSLTSRVCLWNHVAERLTNMLDIHTLILTAKLGRTRKDAQIETCTVFAAALHDVLSAHGIACEIATAVCKGDCIQHWAHSVVKVSDRYFDSRGEFSKAIYSARAKLHPSVAIKIEFQKDLRHWCDEEVEEFDQLHKFYIKALNKAAQPLLLHAPTQGEKEELALDAAGQDEDAPCEQMDTPPSC